MANQFSNRQHVCWHYGTGTAEGKLVERFERRVQRTIAGARIVRNGTRSNPAYLVEQANGARALKRGSELRAI